MRIILREDMENLGKAGEVVSVRDGYWRNYLLPRGMAVPATEKDEVRLAHEQRTIAARVAKLAKELQSEADRLSQVSVSVSRAVGEGDKLYGSVTSRDIAEALAEQGIKVDSKKIQLDEPLRNLGMSEVPIKLGHDTVAKIKVWVVKKEA
ncbi:MAG TPA: 50S ribosomal protein L9 [Polyangia bacterium]|jgi:ribosomal protein L9|nr:50S ribosomal protein L9 [Polyangia bacterium]